MIDRYNCEYCNIIGENDMSEAESGEWVKYDDVKHLLERSDNSDYVECADEIQIHYENHHDVYRCHIIDILKKHFA